MNPWKRFKNSSKKTKIFATLVCSVIFLALFSAALSNTTTFHEHTYTQKIVPPTCTERGYTEYTCACGNSTYTKDFVDSLGHKECIDEAVRATCTTNGLTEGKHCSVCNQILLEQKIIEKTQHGYDNGEITAVATCSTDGCRTYTCKECGYRHSVSVNKLGHTFDNGKISPNSCTATYVCTTCGFTRTEAVKSPVHAYNDGKITKEPTCSATGIKTYTCTKYGSTRTETVQKLEHTYDEGKIVKASTCTTNGTMLYTCTVCGTKKTSSLPKSACTPNANRICTICGKDVAELALTDSETAQSKTIQWICGYAFDYLSDTRQFRLSFSLQDKNEKFLQVPVIVSIKIKNNNTETIYNAAKIITANDYRTCDDTNEKNRTAATVYIDYAEITQGTSDFGTVTFEVYNDYVHFAPYSLPVECLPLKPVTVNLPSTAQTIYCYTDETVCSRVQVSKITYEIRNGKLYFYFSGEKTYDRQGNDYAASCEIRWKLYDEAGYVVASGICNTPVLSVGEKFKNLCADTSCWNVSLRPGDTYTLELLDVR